MAKEPMDFVALRQKAQELSRTLNESTDELNAQLREAEKVLIELKLGVSVSVDMSKDMLWGETLDFGKIDGDWKLLYWSGPVDQALFGIVANADGDIPLRGPNWRSTQLSSASRAVRVRACEHLPALFAGLIKEAEKQIGQVKEGAKRARTFVQSARGLEPEAPPHVANPSRAAGLGMSVSHTTHLVDHDMVVRTGRARFTSTKPGSGKKDGE
jgi:hypothetical protein